MADPINLHQVKEDLERGILISRATWNGVLELAIKMQTQAGGSMEGIDLDKLTRYDIMPDEGASSTIGEDASGEFVRLADVQSLISRRASGGAQ